MLQRCIRGGFADGKNNFKVLEAFTLATQKTDREADKEVKLTKRIER
jgi:hypothetical protein